MPNSEPNHAAGQNGALIKRGELVRGARPPMVLQLGTGEDQAGSISLAVVWQALLQRLKLAIPLGIVCALVAVLAMNYFTEDKFKSQATLKINEKPPALVFNPTDHSPAIAQPQVDLLAGT